MLVEEEMTFERLLVIVEEAIGEISVDSVDRMIDHCLRLMENAIH